MSWLRRVGLLLLVSLSLQVHAQDELQVPLVIYNCEEELPAPEAFKRNADLIHFMLR